MNTYVNTLLDLPQLHKTTPIILRDLVSQIKQTLSALKNLGIDTDSWDPILMSILVRKLDLYTARAYQLERDQGEEPRVCDFLEFLQNCALALESVESTPTSFKHGASSGGGRAAKVAVNLAAEAIDKGKSVCHFCKSYDHKLFSCPKFKLASSNERVAFAKENKLCKICLGSHVRKCRYHFKCNTCKLSHNTLLHQDESPQTPVTLLASSVHSNNLNNTLLPTARVKLIGKDQQVVYVKAILDSGSQASLVTEKAVKVLGLTPTQSNIQLIGVTNTKNNVKYSLPLEIHSLTSPFKVQSNCHVVEKITCNLPQNFIDISHLQIPTGFPLADDT